MSDLYNDNHLNQRANDTKSKILQFDNDQKLLAKSSSINNNNNIESIISSSDDNDNIEIGLKRNLMSNMGKNAHIQRSKKDFCHTADGSTSSDDQIPSPSLLSESPVSSQAQINDTQNNYDSTERLNNSSSPQSPQSSYNSSYGSSSGKKLLNNSGNTITAQVPGGVVTTQNISTVIRPKGNSNSLQFVRIQTPELSKKAVEQIRMAQETNISKEKIKEGEEEWQNNLLNWKSKRRQQFNFSSDHNPNDSIDENDSFSGRKIKTFAEMMEERAKSGNQLGFNLQRYMRSDDDDEIHLSDNLSAAQIDLGRCDKHQDALEVELHPQPIIEDNVRNSTKVTSSSFVQNTSDISNPINRPNMPLNLSHEESNHSSLSSAQSGQPQPKECGDTSMRSGMDNQSSISLAATSNSDPLNSTLKQGIRPPIPSHSSRQVTDRFVQPVVGQMGNGRINDIDDDDDDEDDDDQNLEQEEEEEQKHLQRIAFVEKLRAFENLTKPSPPPTPKIQTKKIVKQSSTNNLPVANKEVTNSKVKLDVQQEPEINDSKAQSPIKSFTSQASPDLSIQKSQPSPKLPPPNQPPLSDATTKIGTPSKQPKPCRDEKDRSVLSVSGKKRCSSCKEELGRGAAAFVVESLSLVYHTNCFRCSVCHVNLANGFRGVDVRVHAGSLHCQNCYSKDGLNYSRV